MPRKNGQLTPREKLFIDPMARTGDRAYAAHRAGLVQPDAAGSQLMARPAIQKAVAARVQELLFSELLPLAYEAHKRLLTDAAVPAGARAQAVKLAYDRTLGSEDSGADKDPSEMTIDEIAERIERLQSEREGRAKDVTPVPLEQAESGVFG